MNFPPNQPPAFIPTITTLPGAQQGLLVPGNVDLSHRPVAHNPDGSISTVRSITIGIGGGKAALLPTVIHGKVVSPQQAILFFKRTGQHLGIFASEKAADRYAQALHLAQAVAYAPYMGGHG